MNNSSSLPVVILGGGGHAKVLIAALRLTNRKLLGVVSPDLVKGSECLGIKVLGNDELILDFDPTKVELVNGIGALPKKPQRWKIAELARRNGFRFARVIHPKAIIASDVDIAEGVQVMAGAVIQPGCKIGQDSIINTGALIDHDCLISDNCHIAPGATLSGSVNIGRYCHIGTSAQIIHNIVVGCNSIVAAGATVYKNVPDNMIIKNKMQTTLQKVDN